jgi:DNA polymerase
VTRTTASGTDARRLHQVAGEAAQCTRCELYRRATQTVFGEGPVPAVIMLVGEQPGDQEDKQGAPFVGPAGRILDEALEEAHIDRGAVYVTNAVKHFKWEARGKRRIHKKPNEMEIAACHQWLEGELRAVDPQVVVALGATAARAVFGRATAIGKNRGRVIPAQQARTFTNADVLVTVHPSYLLRVPDEDRDAAYAEFVKDLKLLAKYV